MYTITQRVGMKWVRVMYEPEQVGGEAVQLAKLQTDLAKWQARPDAKTNPNAQKAIAQIESAITKISGAPAIQSIDPKELANAQNAEPDTARKAQEVRDQGVERVTQQAKHGVDALTVAIMQYQPNAVDTAIQESGLNGNRLMKNLGIELTGDNTVDAQNFRDTLAKLKETGAPVSVILHGKWIEFLAKHPEGIKIQAGPDWVDYLVSLFGTFATATISNGFVWITPKNSPNAKLMVGDQVRVGVGANLGGISLAEADFSLGTRQVATPLNVAHTSGELTRKKVSINEMKALGIQERQDPTTKKWNYILPANTTYVMTNGEKEEFPTGQESEWEFDKRQGIAVGKVIHEDGSLEIGVAFSDAKNTTQQGNERKSTINQKEIQENAQWLKEVTDALRQSDYNSTQWNKIRELASQGTKESVITAIDEAIKLEGTNGAFSQIGGQEVENWKDFGAAIVLGMMGSKKIRELHRTGKLNTPLTSLWDKSDVHSTGDIRFEAQNLNSLGLDPKSVIQSYKNNNQYKTLKDTHPSQGKGIVLSYRNGGDYAKQDYLPLGTPVLGNTIKVETTPAIQDLGDGLYPELKGKNPSYTAYYAQYEGCTNSCLIIVPTTSVTTTSSQPEYLMGQTEAGAEVAREYTASAGASLGKIIDKAKGGNNTPTQNGNQGSDAGGSNTGGSQGGNGGTGDVGGGSMGTGGIGNSGTVLPE